MIRSNFDKAIADPCFPEALEQRIRSRIPTPLSVHLFFSPCILIDYPRDRRYLPIKSGARLRLRFRSSKRCSMPILAPLFMEWGNPWAWAWAWAAVPWKKASVRTCFGRDIFSRDVSGEWPHLALFSDLARGECHCCRRCCSNCGGDGSRDDETSSQYCIR